MAILVEGEYAVLPHGITETKRYEIGRRNYQFNEPKQQARELLVLSEGEEKVMSFTQEMLSRGLA